MLPVKSTLLVLSLLFSVKLFAATGFTTHFSQTDFFFVAGIGTLIGLVYWVMNFAAQALSGLEQEEGEKPSWQGRIRSMVDDIVQARTVIFYASLIFLSFYLIYALVRGTAYESHAVEWMNLAVRWTHVVFGIAWIGASFYFNFLENSLNRTKGLREGIAGNLWAVHGGGFYYLEKYKTAPPEIPKDLHWFKYEAYFTWLSGFTLLIIVYYLDAKVYLIDPAVLEISPTAAIGIGLATLAGGWLVYDTLCKSALAQQKILFAGILLVFTTLLAWFLSHVFSSRAAYVHVGAMLGTLMVGNVFRVIIPSQKAMVKAAKEGKLVDPSLGKKALMRSLHNNYFTLPVIFIMISNHFPSTYGGTFNWMVLIGLSLTSVMVKHYLNLMEKGEKAVWILPIAVAGMLALALVTAPHTKDVCKPGTPAGFAEVNSIVSRRCVQCHAANPTDDILKVAPNGIMFDDPKNIIKYADRILNRAVITKTMPQGNKTHITQEERDVIQCWIEHGAKE
jgi:uncharacterized membrane protein